MAKKVRALFQYEIFKTIELTETKNIRSGDEINLFGGVWVETKIKHEHQQHHNSSTKYLEVNFQ